MSLRPHTKLCGVGENAVNFCYFRAGLRATHRVLKDYLGPASAALVTPGLGVYTSVKLCSRKMLCDIVCILYLSEWCAEVRLAATTANVSVNM